MPTFRGDLTASARLRNIGLRVRDTDETNSLSIVPGSDLTADRTLTVITGDADRTLTLNAALTISNTCSYSTGSFTPTVTLVGGSGNTVPVYTTNYGHSVKIGETRLVEIFLNGDGGDEGAGTGRVNIALPEAASINTNDFLFPVGYALNSTSNFMLYGQIAASATTIQLNFINALNTQASFTGANQSNSTRTIALKFFYRVAA